LQLARRERAVFDGDAARGPLSYVGGSSVLDCLLERHRLAAGPLFGEPAVIQLSSGGGHATLAIAAPSRMRQVPDGSSNHVRGAEEPRRATRPTVSRGDA